MSNSREIYEAQKQKDKLYDLQKNIKEYKKCKNSPVYFYNKYVRKEKDKILTEQEYEEYVKLIKNYRNNILKPIGLQRSHPVLVKDCYDKLPEFLKK